MKLFVKSFWEKTPVLKVDSLPLSINGENLYQVPYQKDKRMKAVADGRPWDRDMSVKWKGAEKDSVRAQHCKGSYKCENPKCSFKQQHGKANKIQFEKNRDGDVVYKGCGRCSIFVPCLARKYMDILPDLPEVRVYYVDIRILAKQKEKFPYAPLSNNLFNGTQI